MEESFRFRDSIVARSKSRSSRTVAINDEDHLFMHILECIGALSCIRADQKGKNVDSKMEGSAAALLASKHRVFWQTVREIADREAALEDISAKEYDKSIQKNWSLDYVLECFPDDAKRSDGWMWLPLHWAVTLPAIHLSDIETIFAANPAAIKAHVNDTRKRNPCHLAAMVKNPRLEIIRRLQIYYPLFGSTLDGDANTPLHLAACYSNSVAMVRELAQLHPAALERNNVRGETPLHLAAANSNSVDVIRGLAQLYPAALQVESSDGDTPLHLAVKGSFSILRELISLSPTALVSMNEDGQTPLAVITSSYGSISEFHEKLRVLLEAAPQAARIACSNDRNSLPLHQMLCNSPPAEPEMVAMLLAAYKEAVNMPDNDGMLPIHNAAQYAPPRLLQMIAEENMSSNLSVIVPFYGSPAHLAVCGRRLDNLRYIHAMIPELLLSVDDSRKTPLHQLIDDDDVGGSLDELSSPLSPALNILRFLLRHRSSLASARDINGETLYDRLPADDARLAYSRRLLLLAGASSLYPGVLQEMNYAARRTALLVFYSSATKPSIFFRIRHAAGGPVLMRSIVTFL